MKEVIFNGRNIIPNAPEELTKVVYFLYVCLFYPNSPRHPRQKYLLTVKGIALYNKISQNNVR